MNSHELREFFRPVKIMANNTTSLKSPKKSYYVSPGNSRNLRKSVSVFSFNTDKPNYPLLQNKIYNSSLFYPYSHKD
ncbi:MAG: hypothetical protein ACI8P3_003140 [Saprospiraceae bacterium]|jgi:hypothetical protein